MDFYEIGVYLVIVVVASTSVFGVMWLLIRSMTPKRSKSRRLPAPSTTGDDPGAGRKPARAPKKSNKDGKKKGKKDNVQELKEYPENKLLTQDVKKANNSKQDVKNNDNDFNDGEIVLPVAASGSAALTDEKVEINAANAVQEGAASEGGEISLPNLPSMDTLTEEEDEMPKEEIDLMSVFESEEDQDSTTSDLAANLFDVDVSNIEKLGSEISQFLSGKR